MSERFKKLKRKYLVGAILKSLVCGLSFGVFVVGVILLALKLSAIDLSIVLYILMGVGAAVVGFIVSFIFFRPTNKKVAKRLDDEYALEERVQTSLEYSEQVGTIVEMQRYDTEHKLEQLRTKNPKFSKIWQYFVAALVALTMAVTAFFIPAKQAEAAGPTGDEAPGDLTGFKTDQVRDVINDVNKSDLSASLKAAVVAPLETLLETLEDPLTAETITQGEINTAVLTAITVVEGVINSSSSYLIIGPALEANGQADFGQAITKGGNSYRYLAITEYSQVESFSLKKNEAARSNIDGPIDAVLTTFKIVNADGTDNNDLNINEFLNNLMTVSNSVLGAISELGSDNVRDVLYEFANDLVYLYMDVVLGDVDTDGAKAEIKTKFDNLKINLAGGLSEQAYAGAMRKFVCNKLRSIFGLGGIEGAEATQGGGSGGNNNGGGPAEPEDGSGPGNGGGNTNYGSNDYIWYDNDYVKYSDLLTSYKEKLQAYIDDGTLTAEQAARALEYFKWMYGTNKEQNN